MTVPHALAERLPAFPVFCAEVLGLEQSTRHGHIVIAKALDGLPLDDKELALFRTHTGREHPRPGGYPFGLTLTGRQSGKTEQAGARLVYAATSAAIAHERDVACVGISQDQRAAQRVLFAYVSRFFEQPLLRGLVLAQTADAITLVGNVKVLVLPCRPAAIRGLRCKCVVLDEVAHFRSTENVPLDREAWRAALPTLLTTGGKLFALSSPYAASGLAYELHRQHFGQDTDVLVWQSPSYVLHPGLSSSALDQIRAADADGAAAEIEGEFLTNTSALLDEEVIAAAVDAGITARPRASQTYVAHADVATGTSSTGDHWGVAIAHLEGDVGVLDALLVIRPPFSVSTAAEQTAALCRSYGVRDIRGDAFAKGFSADAFARAGLRWRAAERNTSDCYIDFAAAMSSGRVRLLDRPDLLREFRGLERRRGATRDRVDHRRGAHDDAAAAAAGALVAVLAPAPGPRVGFARLPWLSGDAADGIPPGEAAGSGGGLIY